MQPSENRNTALSNNSFLNYLGVATKEATMPVICAATGCNNKFVKGSEIRFYRYVFTVCAEGARSFAQAIGAKSRVYDGKGRLLSNNTDMCDCLDVDCMGCFYPCTECGSRKCGVECRCDRKWLYEQVEVEGGEIIRNKFAL
ncbi:hypothetical protein F2P81_004214 [Scophthalmus maximus]|uniref:ARF7 effector protein C-terminal domain-containing protein n=1 Tax=Scophthalmus maximus TaxID=52904 RepID=A0A6A4T944_SCOMX|nr:hypothetical protein F2P81_004214 [Scophthalmus maximus]